MRGRSARLWLLPLAGAATHSTGMMFSRRNLTFTHSIDPWIDDERTKAVNGLIFTECAAGFEMVERLWLPPDAREAEGLMMHTGGAVAVVLLNSCKEPAQVFPAPEAAAVPPTGGRWRADCVRR